MKLAYFRNNAGLTQRQLAEMIGMDQAQVVRAEKMAKTAKLETYRLCADALKVSLAEIFANDPGEWSSATLRGAEILEQMSDSTRRRAVDFLGIYGTLPPDDQDRLAAIIFALQGFGTGVKSQELDEAGMPPAQKDPQ